MYAILYAKELEKKETRQPRRAAVRNCYRFRMREGGQSVTTDQVAFNHRSNRNRSSSISGSLVRCAEQELLEKAVATRANYIRLHRLFPSQIQKNRTARSDKIK